MNYLFTPKVRVVLFALLISHLALKAQTTSGNGVDTAKTSNIDTTLSQKAKEAQLVKSDTTLVVKAGATLVQKKDTTLVINADSAFIKKAEAAVAKKADDLLITENMNAPKQDSSAAVKPSTQTATKAISPHVVISDTVSVLKADTAISKTDNSSAVASNQVPANTSDNQVSAVQPVKTDSSAVMPKQEPEQSATEVSKPVDTVLKAKVDTTQTAKIDTPVMKPDTAIAKKSDTTTFNKSDTTLMIAADTVTNHQLKAENLYLEIGGPGLAISGNYDARFKKERSGWGYRVGIGYFGSGGNTVFTIPFQINYLYGEHAHKLELGAGTTFLNSTGTNVGNSKWEFDRVTGFIGTATIGYRYQPDHKGFNFRIAFVPILYDEGLIPAGGISFGYTFK